MTKITEDILLELGFTKRDFSCFQKSDEFGAVYEFMFSAVEDGGGHLGIINSGVTSFFAWKIRTKERLLTIWQSITDESNPLPSSNI